MPRLTSGPGGGGGKAPRSRDEASEGFAGGAMRAALRGLHPALRRAWDLMPGTLSMSLLVEFLPGSSRAGVERRRDPAWYHEALEVWIGGTCPAKKT